MVFRVLSVIVLFELCRARSTVEKGFQLFRREEERLPPVAQDPSSLPDLSTNRTEVAQLLQRVSTCLAGKTLHFAGVSTARGLAFAFYEVLSGIAVESWADRDQQKKLCVTDNWASSQCNFTIASANITVVFTWASHFGELANAFKLVQPLSPSVSFIEGVGLYQCSYFDQFEGQSTQLQKYGSDVLSEFQNVYSNSSRKWQLFWEPQKHAYEALLWYFDPHQVNKSGAPFRLNQCIDYHNSELKTWLSSTGTQSQPWFHYYTDTQVTVDEAIAKEAAFNFSTRPKTYMADHVHVSHGTELLIVGEHLKQLCTPEGHWRL
eukprot:TRINITY_DN32535_c0_g1_i1.p1 TRINITY_DN32535_c0_g1~~TRINITY_DN32535_c0_g1_i1.p1  ORF type:complete len:320 (+),score=36.40 TRINITY_DN32535_c0_g1_i1:42-1001(+)